MNDTVKICNLLTHDKDFSGGGGGKESACQYRRHKRRGFDPWVGKIPWRRAWQPTPVFLPGESHGQGRLAGCSAWLAQSDTPEATWHTHLGGRTSAPLLCFTCRSSPLYWPLDYQVEATAAEDEAEPRWEREGAGLPTARGPCRAGSTEGTSVPQPSPCPSAVAGPLVWAGALSPSSLQGPWPHGCRGSSEAALERAHAACLCHPYPLNT